MKIEDFPLEDRPYEKCLQLGASSLGNAELIAILLRTGTRDKSSIELAWELLKDDEGKQSLLSLYDKPVEELKKINGIGTVKAVQITALLELSKRLARAERRSHMKWTEPTDIAQFFMEELRHLKKEQFLTVFLDTKCKCIGYEKVSEGTLNASVVHPREVFIRAIHKSAYSIVVLHNHPSGDPTPSREDIHITNKLQASGEIVGIKLLDHIIIGDGCFISLKQEGYL